MGSFGSLLTAVSGLRAQSFSMQNISGNIANSSTPGFKRVDTSFADLVPEQPLARQVSGSVNSFSRATNTLSGEFLPTNLDTNIALNGDGFFAVGQRPSQTSSIVRQSPELYTRRGDFELDRQGYLVNGAGYALRGTMLDRETGLPVATQNGGFIQISQELLGRLDPQPTTTIDYAVDLPTNPTTTDSGTTAAHGYFVNPASVQPGGNVLEADAEAFLRSTLPGGSVTVYNSVGAIESMNLRWARTADGPDTWQLYYESNSGGDAWRQIGVDVTFNADGSLNGPATLTTAPAVVEINDIDFQEVTIDFGGNIRQLSVSSVQPGLLEQDGYGVGRYDSVAVSEEGVVSVAYSNGQVVPVAEISLVGFYAPNALRRVDGGAFEATRESGDPSVAFARATVMSGGIESSNVDISEEFAKMIVTQQAYTANTRVISTAQEMIRDVLNVVR
ncbi:flagellar hook protein FlgE [Salinarimonas ramus]|uniref:Flagellar hook protein FlgE n=1 Tax=Salinarimonas ramus TaxID=690164 RepID=A0A917Q7C9_9HYPH|nr:flagellar hook-basal body complex protein [Salinarimonas ramus]GGK26816.1 hypothetical protein GCM10011322_11610 [Salinarimonas ramus]